MAGINFSLETPKQWLHLAPSAPSATDIALDPGYDLACRLVVVGKILGPVTLIDHKGDEHTFSLAFLQNTSGQVLGQWTAIKGGSLCYDFHVAH